VLLPDEELRVVAVTIQVGVAAVASAEVAFPLGQIIRIDVAIAVEISRQVKREVLIG